MFNKKLSVLVAAIVSVSAQASFDSGSQVFIAIDSSNGDTFVQDLGVTGSNASEAVSLPTNGFTNYTWTVLGASNGNAIVTGPPSAGSYRAYENNGVLSTAATNSTVDGTTMGSGGDIELKLAALNTWLSEVSTAANSADFVTIGAGAAGSYSAVAGDYYNSGRMLTGNASGDLGLIRQSNDQGNGIDGIGGTGTGRDGTVASVTDEGYRQFSFDGTTATVSAVPVPAAAWLFGSALAGLTVIRRRK